MAGISSAPPTLVSGCCENLALPCKHLDQQIPTYHFIVALGGVLLSSFLQSLRLSLMAVFLRRFLDLLGSETLSDAIKPVKSAGNRSIPCSTLVLQADRLSHMQLTIGHCERVAVKDSSYCMGKDVEIDDWDKSNRNSPSGVICRRVSSFCKSEKAVKIPHLLPASPLE